MRHCVLSPCVVVVVVTLVLVRLKWVGDGCVECALLTHYW